jgi:hypothetical protein
MATKQQQNEDVYDSVFNFIFDIQKSKEKREIPRKNEGMSEYTSALMEVGTQPFVYPLESAFASINKTMSKALGVELEGGVSGGIGSGMFANPVKYVNSEIKKNRAKAKWASIGGGVHRAADGALLSLYAKSLGAKGRNAARIGKLYQGLSDPDQKEEDILDNAIKLRANVIAGDNPNLNGKLLSQIMNDLQSVGSKNDRIHKSFEILRQQGIDKEKSLEIAYSMWGDVNDKDQGVYRRGEGEWYGKLNDINKQAKLTPNDKDKLEELRKIEDPQQRRRKMYLFFKREKGFASQEAFNRSKELASVEVNDSKEIANDSLHWALAHQLRRKLERQGERVSTHEIKRRIERRLDLEGKKTLGMQLQRGVLLTRWLSNANAWSGILLDGNWEKFGVDGLGFTNIVKEKELKDEDGNVIGSYYEGADSVIGKILGKNYYLHPNNLIRGLIGDGSLWLKWAADKNGVVNKKSFSYLMSQMSLQKTLSGLSKPMQGLTNKVKDLINPMFKTLQNKIKGLAVKVLGATGVGGVLVSLLMNFVSDRFTYIINQIAVALVLAIVGVLFAIFGWMGVLYSDPYTAAITDTDDLVMGVTDSNVFTDQDLGINTEK